MLINKFELLSNMANTICHKEAMFRVAMCISIQNLQRNDHLPRGIVPCGGDLSGVGIPTSCVFVPRSRGERVSAGEAVPCWTPVSPTTATVIGLPGRRVVPAVKMIPRV